MCEDDRQNYISIVYRVLILICVEVSVWDSTKKIIENADVEKVLILICVEVSVWGEVKLGKDDNYIMS